MGNIGTHLKSAFTDWLFGALAGAGIKLPEKLDLAGILDLVDAGARPDLRRASARAWSSWSGAPVVERMEQAVDVFKTLATKGVGGLWEWIKDKLANLEEMVLGQIKEFLIEKVIKGGITWIISLLNPAAAFIKACKAIYDIVMFFVERGAQMMEFVNAVLDSIGAIAKGNIGDRCRQGRRRARQGAPGRDLLPRQPARPRRHLREDQVDHRRRPQADRQGRRLGHHRRGQGLQEDVRRRDRVGEGEVREREAVGQGQGRGRQAVRERQGARPQGQGDGQSA